MALLHHFLLLLSSFLVFSLYSVNSASVIPPEHKSPKIIHRNLEPIDQEGKFQVEWEVDFEKELINFYIEVETKGFVGFGISNSGGMTGADIIIAGVSDDGTHYFSDRHGVGLSEPVVDDQQDWVLNCISENATHTSLNVSRPLNTCDEEGDVAITRDTTKLIWSYGATDVIGYHGGSRGSHSANLLDPPMPPFDESSADKWLIVPSAIMPKQETTYWCSIHKTPDTYTAKRHIVAFNTKLEGETNVKHTHHFVVFKCAPDPTTNLTADETFGKFVGQDGNPCFDAEDETTVPVALCKSIVYAWAVGGNMMTLPEDVGFPITEDGPEYFMVEMHYDNPDLVEGLRVVSTLEVYNTLVHRPIEAGIAVVMNDMIYSHIIPPNVESYVTAGQCDGSCTLTSVPPTGTTIFNVMLHSHKAGRKMKLRHFRDNTELPWISNDDNYDFDYQQNRPLREFVKILPGDHLTVECTTNTIGRTDVTISGYGTMEEMCQAVFWVYPRDAFPGCQSAYNETILLNRFGIEAIAPWHHHDMKVPVVTAPAALAGKTYVEVLSAAMKDWTADDVAALQEETRYHNNYQGLCGSPDVNPVVTYPDIDKPYTPINPCLSKSSSRREISSLISPHDVVEPTCRPSIPEPTTTTTTNAAITTTTAAITTTTTETPGGGSSTRYSLPSIFLSLSISVALLSYN